jgi:hypothetical protein
MCAWFSNGNWIGIYEYLNKSIGVRIINASRSHSTTYNEVKEHKIYSFM